MHSKKRKTPTFPALVRESMGFLFSFSLILIFRIIPVDAKLFTSNSKL